MTPLPVIVISGYLGAGKTTLINQLLRAAQGRRIMVLVNDFGAINIDADLLDSATEDTLTLTNGCVCCTMGADLFMALGDALDRRPRPDVLVIEASGIAEPRRIAEAARAEPDLRYGGIVTVVDGLNFLTSEADIQIGRQVRDQITAADLLVLSKSRNDDVLTRLAMLTDATILSGNDIALRDLILSDPAHMIAATAPHPKYANWSYTGMDSLTRGALDRRLAHPPKGVFRIKGHVLDSAGGGWELHLVGKTPDIRRVEGVTETSLVAIGLRNMFDPKMAEIWWHTAASPNGGSAAENFKSPT